MLPSKDSEQKPHTRGMLQPPTVTALLFFSIKKLYLLQCRFK
ncbi:hypothetical protein PTH_0797 [Pelotomaculum thermopropionicum SI]|uniref:Uncharacterized protein n=1 Tax=Pelotomaculum thermopropionicum (strain DSM 13744 / JCM 10971 / SI) TaxID=370438 RepID=A5D440_PELTS|nr:hypothetical protein PTH_0797 [Pelotomaculum thermopropionicum SI]